MISTISFHTFNIKMYLKKIFFSQVISFDLSQTKIEVKPYEQIRTQYWSNKMSIVLCQLRFLAEY